MDAVHLHLALNHFPIILPVVGVLVMLGGIFLRTEAVKRTAFAIFISGGMLTIPAFVTGEASEDSIENLSGINEQDIETHEDTVKKFALSSYFLGIFAVFGLWSSLKNKSYAPTTSITAVMVALVVIFLAKQTGTSGGEIRHPEIKNGQINPNSARPPDDD